VLGEGNFICVVGVGFIRVDSLRSVRVLSGCYHFSCCWFGAHRSTRSKIAAGCWWCCCCCYSITESRLRRVAVSRESCYWGGCLKSTELGRCIHLWGNVGGDRCVWSSISIISRHASSALRCSVRCRSKVKDPYDLDHVSMFTIIHTEVTYIDHRKQDMTSSSCFSRTIRRINRSIDGRTRQYKATSKVSNDGYMICLCSIGCYDHKNSNNNAEHVRNTEPCIIWKLVIWLLCSSCNN